MYHVLLLVSKAWQMHSYCCITHSRAKRLNEDIFDTMYFAACEASCELAERKGAFESYIGSPASKGE